MIENLKLYNFRNYKVLDVTFGSRINLFFGENGQGKTNLIEALYLNLTGTYLRSNLYQELIFKGEKQASLSSLIEKKNIKYEVRTLLASQKDHFLDEKKVSSKSLFLKHPALSFTPECLYSIKAGSEERRKLVDNLVTLLFPQNSELIQSYKKVLLTRNKILKNYKEQISSKNETFNLLKSINPLFFEKAVLLTYARLEALKLIEPYFFEALRNILGKNIKIETTYIVSKNKIELLIPEDIHKIFYKRWQELYLAELSAGISLLGPHRHEIEFFFNNENARNFCSQGQQRAIILAFKLAQIVYHNTKFGLYPYLFLDDVLSELDENRCEDLIQFLQKVPTQVFITSTSFERLKAFQKENLSLFKVHQGHVFINS